MTEYITVIEALTLHKVVIKKWGGSDGIRDMGALDSAIHRSQSGYYNDVIEEASALFESLIINHPFIDGNKRVAFACLDVFLRINGYRINASSAEIYKMLMKLFEEQKVNFKEIEKYLRTIVIKA